MFANTNDVELHSTTTEDAKIVWKCYHDRRVSLIQVARVGAGGGGGGRRMSSLYAKISLFSCSFREKLAK